MNIFSIRILYYIYVIYIKNILKKKIKSLFKFKYTRKSIRETFPTPFKKNYCKWVVNFPRCKVSWFWYPSGVCAKSAIALLLGTLVLVTFDVEKAQKARGMGMTKRRLLRNLPPQLWSENCDGMRRLNSMPPSHGMSICGVWGRGRSWAEEHTRGIDGLMKSVSRGVEMLLVYKASRSVFFRARRCFAYKCELIYTSVVGSEFISWWNGCFCEHAKVNI